jgi:hypothetical protein
MWIGGYMPKSYTGNGIILFVKKLAGKMKINILLTKENGQGKKQVSDEYAPLTKR